MSKSLSLSCILQPVLLLMILSSSIEAQTLSCDSVEPGSGQVSISSEQLLFKDFLETTAAWVEYDQSAGSDSDYLSEKNKIDLMVTSSGLLKNVVRKSRENNRLASHPISLEFYKGVESITIQLYEIYAAGTAILLAKTDLDIETIAALGATFITNEGKYLAKPILSFGELEARKNRYRSISLPKYSELFSELKDSIRQYDNQLSALKRRCDSGPLTR